MGIETAAAVGAGLGGVGGAVRGGKGTPDVRQFTDQTTRTQQQREFAPATEQERQLQQASLQNFLEQQRLAEEAEARLGQFGPLQEAAIAAQQQLLGGQAFQLTPEEEASIQAERTALVAQQEADINRLLDERLRGVTSSAVGRGLRGGALAELQGRLITEGAQQLGEAARQADILAAQRRIQAPLQRIQAQQPAIGTALTLQEQLQQQQIANRQALQNPLLLGALQRERLAGGTTTGTTTTRGTQLTPGQAGSLGGAILGGLGGLGAGASIGADVSGIFGGGGLLDANDLRRQASAAQPIGAVNLGQRLGGIV